MKNLKNKLRKTLSIMLCVLVVFSVAAMGIPLNINATGEAVPTETQDSDSQVEISTPDVIEESEDAPLDDSEVDSKGEIISSDESGQEPEEAQESEQEPSQEPKQVSEENEVVEEQESLPGDPSLNSDYGISFTLQPHIDGKTEYYTGESVLVNLDIMVSHTTAIIQKPVITITFPSELVANFVASELQTQKTNTTDNADGTITIIYTFDQFVGGTAFTIPIRINNTAYDTPTGFKIPISASLDDGTQHIATADTLTLSFKTTTYTTQKGIVVGSTSWSQNETAYGGFPRSNNPNIIDDVLTAPVGFYFRAYPNSTGAEDVGARRLSQIIINDALPAGAVFLASDNPNWTYNSATNTATYAFPSSSIAYGSSYISTYGPLYLRFPGQEANTEKVYTNNATLTFVPKIREGYESEPSNVASNASLNFKLFAGIPAASNATKTCNISYLYDYVAAKKQDFVWTLTAKNLNDFNKNLENLEIVDYDLDPFLKYTSIDFTNSAANFTGTISIYLVNENDAEVLLQGNIDMTTAKSFTIPDGTKSIIIKADAGSVLLPGKGIIFKVHTTFKDPEGTTTKTGKALYNDLSVTGKLEGIDEPITDDASYYVYYYPYDPTVSVSKTVSEANALVNEKISYTLRVYSYGLSPEHYIDAQQIIDILPAGFDYVSDSARVSYYNGFTDSLESPQPRVVSNYKGTGRTALIWDFTKKLTGTASSSSTYTYLYLYYDTKVTYQAKKGANTNDVYLVYDNNTQASDPNNVVITPSSVKTDTLDLNNNGDTTEKFAGYSRTITYVPPQEIVASKFAKGNQDSAFSSGYGRTEIGSNMSYNLQVANYSLRDAESLVVLDILPYEGDTNIIDGDSRESQYSQTLTGAVGEPTVSPACDVEFDIYYNTTLPSGDVSSYVSGSGWTTAPSDYSKVKAIKIVMKDGYVLPKETSVNFTFNCYNPLDLSLEDGDIAYNSAAISFNTTDFLETTKVGARIYTYEINGTVFNDLDKNGIYGEDDQVFNGYEVVLLDEDGEPALDLSGQPIKATTNADGEYTMTTYRAGKYQVKAAVPQYHLLTTYTPNSTGVIGSNILEDGEVSNLFTIGPDVPVFTINAGFYADRYSVSYNANAGDDETGTVPETAYYLEDDEVTVADGITREGYEFVCWNTKNDGEGDDYSPKGKFTMPAEDVVLYAIWEAVNYKVIYDANADGAETSPVPSTIEYIFEDTVTVEKGITREGYEFDCWNTQADGKGEDLQPDDTFSMPSNDVTLYAVWTPIEYDVIYNANTTDETSTVPSTVQYIFEDEVTVEDGITRVGYTFIGWNTQDDGEGEDHAPGSEFSMPAKDVVLYAIWEPLGYEVIYDANAGDDNTSTVPPTAQYDFTETVTVEEGITREGYEFVCWNTQADGEGEDLFPEGTFNMPSESVTLYAVWTPLEYDVIYNANTIDETSTVPTAATYAYRSTVIVEEGLTRTGYTFVRWDTDENGEGDTYAPGSSFTMPNQEVILYAIWEPLKHDVIYDANTTDTTSPVPATQKHDFESSVIIEHGITRDGWYFIGWNTEENGEGTTYTPDEGTFIMPNMDVTLYAVWSLVPLYDLSYDSNTTDTTSPVPPTTKHYEGDKATVGLAITREGYRFEGWNTTADGDGDTYQPDDLYEMPANSVILYAMWAPGVNSVIYHPNADGDDISPVPAEKQYEYQTIVEVEEGITREGYSFGGWNTQEDGNGDTYVPGSTFIMPDNDYHLYAMWTPNNYNVIYNANTTDTTSAVPATVKHAYKDTVTAEKGISRTGYTFDGWNTQANGKGTTYKPGDKFSMPASDVTLYAMWTRVKYVVTTEAKNGKVTGAGEYFYGDTVTLKATPDKGYRFVGWSSDDISIGTDENVLVFKMPAKNVHVVAKFEKIPDAAEPDTGDRLPSMWILLLLFFTSSYALIFLNRKKIDSLLNRLINR